MLTGLKPVAGHHIPKGTSVGLPIWGLQRDPAIWTDPTAFLPERWIEGAPEQASEAEQQAWMPFGELLFTAAAAGMRRHASRAGCTCLFLGSKAIMDRTSVKLVLQRQTAQSSRT